MSDIERRLRELGERARSDQPAAHLPPQVTRRVKRRRLATVATSVLVTAALAFGGAVAVGAFESPAEIAPAERDGEVLIDYHRTGGFAGEDTRLIVRSDGTALVTIADGGELITTEYETTADYVRAVEAGLAAIDWRTAAAKGRSGPVLAVDVVRFELRHEDYVVSGYHREKSRDRVDDLVALLDALLRSLRIEPQPAPTLSLSDTTLSPGDVVELLIEAEGQNMWSSLTGLDAQRGDDWERLYYWATYDDRRSGPIEVTRREGTKASGYTGSATFELLIPELEPGTYRITKTFVQPDPGDSGELRTVTAEVRFDLIESGTSQKPQDFRAIWPEDTLAEAEEACAAAAKEDASHGGEGEDVVSMRHDAASVVLEFGYEVLGWGDATAIERSGQPGFADNRTVYELRRGPQGASPRPPVLVVEAIEALEGCWSVNRVSPPPDQPMALSMTIRGRFVELEFDDLGADTIAFEIGHGPNTLTSEPTGRGGRITSRLTYAPNDTGHFLILFKDEESRVFSAVGRALPAGNFTDG